MNCFWERGYTATSMKHLEASTGLVPSSLYNGFGSKDGLFAASVEHYIDRVVRQRVAFYLQGPYLSGKDKGQDDPLAGIEAFYYDCFEGPEGRIGSGCLLINISTELGPRDKAIRKVVVSGMRLVERSLAEALTRAQQLGLLDASVDTKARAQHLGLLLNGMLVQARVSENNRWLNVAMDNVRSLLH
jgi:AcrR family transcriptional regulator